MKKKLTVILIAMLTSCNFSDETTKISGGWTFAIEGKHDKVISKGNKYIPCEVVAYDDNDDFIIAKQKPMKECFFRMDTIIHYPTTDSIFYWIIDHKRKLFLGPLMYRDYFIKRKLLKVPQDLKLSK